MEPAGDQDKETVTRRLFQGLEECVGCPDRHSVGVVNQANLPFSDEWSIDELLFDLPYLLDFDLRGGCFWVGLDDEVIRVSPRGYLQARSATPTAVLSLSLRGLFAVEGLSQSHGGHRLSDSRFAIEQIRMGQAPIVQGRLKEGDGLLVACDFGERHGLSVSRCPGGIGLEPVQDQFFYGLCNRFQRSCGIDHHDASMVSPGQRVKPRTDFPMEPFRFSIEPVLGGATTATTESDSDWDVKE
jgi:hypothetical protein